MNTSSPEYTCRISWTGNRGQGTHTYRGYDRSWNVETPGKPIISCSNDPLLGGDPSLANPEDLLLCSLAACHMLWYLHLASDAGVVVMGYQDNPKGIGELEPGGAGRFVEVCLHPRITLAENSDHVLADALHARIHDVCFIARSMNFPVTYAASYVESR